MVVAANDTPAAPPPVVDNPAQGGVNGGGYGGTGGGHKNNNNMAAKGDAWSKFTGNTTEMKGHVFQPCHVSKNANQYHNTVEVLSQYVAKENKMGRELMSLFLPMPTQLAVAEPPDDPTPTGRTTDGALKLTTRDTKMFELSIKRYLEWEDQFKDDMHSLFYVVLGQCDKAITAKLESIDGYTAEAAQLPLAFATRPCHHEPIRLGAIPLRRSVSSLSVFLQLITREKDRNRTLPCFQNGIQYHWATTWVAAPGP